VRIAIAALLTACWVSPSASPTAAHGGIRWVFDAGERAAEVRAAFATELDQHGIVGFAVNVDRAHVVVDIPGMSNDELTGATSLLIAAARNRAHVMVREESHVVFPAH